MFNKEETKLNAFSSCNGQRSIGCRMKYDAQRRTKQIEEEKKQRNNKNESKAKHQQQRTLIEMSESKSQRDKEKRKKNNAKEQYSLRN